MGESIIRTHFSSINNCIDVEIGAKLYKMKTCIIGEPTEFDLQHQQQSLLLFYVACYI